MTTVHPDNPLPLELIKPGQWAEVLEITGEPTYVTRMADIGVRAGSRLRVLRQGSPCLLLVGGCRLSFRGQSHMQILVRPLQATG
ncbi:MAG TPA: FeoA family protein [Gemmataceae bacterium]|nr:FeoA family protein [Gemmataceae bacterium]